MEGIEMSHIIWSNKYMDDEVSLEGCVTPEELYDIYLDDRRRELAIFLPEDIITIADLGLWNGRRPAYKELGNCMAECLHTGYDITTWYIDQFRDLRCEDVHHDGTNYYLYRMWKPGLRKQEKEKFLTKLCRGILKKNEINRYTKSIGDIVTRMYGW